MMKSLSLTSLLVFFIFHFVNAQDRFGQGFYVTNEGDTVRGYIQFRNTYHSRILFRPERSGLKQWLTVDEVQSFSFLSGPSYQQMSFAEAPSLPAVRIFAKTIMTGKVDLFGYRGRFFIGSEGKGRFRLAKGKASDENVALKNFQTNTAIFNIVFQDCPTVKESAPKTAIAEKTLVDLLESYNSCLDVKDSKFYNQKPKRNVYVGFFIGQSSSDLAFSGNEQYLNNANFPSSVKPSFGVLIVSQSRNPSPTLALQTELMYTSATFNDTSVYTNDAAGYDIVETSNIEIEYSLLTFKLGFRVTGRSNKINPYIGFGPAFNSSRSIKSHVHRTTKINDSSEETDFEPTLSIGGGFWTGIGLKKNISEKTALFLELNYTTGTMAYGGKITMLNPRIGIMF